MKSGKMPIRATQSNCSPSSRTLSLYPMASPPARIGYCTNVHAGTDVATICEKLETFAVEIAKSRLRRCGTAGPLPVGLWIPASAAGELSRGDAAGQFAHWLSDHHLFPLTINGFPYDNFHLPVVKHRVYRPAWWERERLEYTLQLARLLDQLLPEEDTVGSISTLPLGWPGPLGNAAAADGRSAADQRHDADIAADAFAGDSANIARAGENLRTLAGELLQLEQQTGRRIVVAIEPEPGCLLDRCGDVVRFFEKELPAANHRRFLSVCHDVCHSAVMFESQSEALATYARAGIMVGKVQISSAIDVPLSQYSLQQRAAAIEELAAFAEDRYLHQTGILDGEGRFRLIEDLPEWLAADVRRMENLKRTDGQRSDAGSRARGTGDDQHLRIHFHVPIFRRTLGHLGSTQQAIPECIAALNGPDAPDFTGHFEVETYAWTVLPESISTESTSTGSGELSGLAAGIAQELDWLESIMNPSQPSHGAASG